MEHAFHKIDGTKITDVVSYVKQWLGDNKETTNNVYVGCDSQAHGHYVKYATVIVLRRMGKGAHVIKSIEKRKLTPEMRKDVYAKLWVEVEYAVDVAKQLAEGGVKDITIHVDYNSDPNSGSHRLLSAGVGIAESFGFKAHGKPFSWASSHIADKYN